MISEYGVPVIFLQTQQSSGDVVLGIAQVVITAISAIAAIAASAIAWRSLRMSRDPEVVAYLHRDDDSGAVFYIVSNIGGGCAYDVRQEGLDFGYVQPELRSKAKESFMAGPIGMMAPGELRRTVICDASFAERNLIGRKAGVRIFFKRRKNGKEFCRSYVLDYASFANSIYPKSDAHRMAVALESIDKKIGT